MKKTNLHIEIVSSSIMGLSSMGHTPRTVIQKVLGRHYSQVGITIVDNLTDLEALVAKKPDIVLLGMKFIPLHSCGIYNNTEKIWLSKYLSERGVACTGSGSLSHQIERDKVSAKEYVINSNLATSVYHVSTPAVKLKRSNIPFDFPMFVKPTNRGGGEGVDANSVVHTFNQLVRKVTSIHDDVGSDALIEKYLSGREFSVGILKDEVTSNYDVMPIELIAPQDNQGSRLLSKSVKSADAEEAKAISDVKLRKSICELAINVFHTLGARDYGRIDIRLDENDNPHFLEANLIPSLMDNYGSFPKACKINAGLSYEKMLMQIVQLGSVRMTTTEKKVDPIAPIKVIRQTLKPLLES